jgi:hypothetical protein
MKNYQDYMEGKKLPEEEREALFRFFWEIVGCVNLGWKEHSY